MELIGPNRDMVCDMFWEEDARLILALPVHEDWPNKVACILTRQVSLVYKVLTKFVRQTSCARKVEVAHMVVEPW